MSSNSQTHDTSEILTCLGLIQANTSTLEGKKEAQDVINVVDILLSMIGYTWNITDYSIVEDFSNDVKALSDLRSDDGAIVSLLDDIVNALRFDFF